MLEIILIAVFAAIGIVVMLAYRRPDQFRIARSASVQAPPEKVYVLINDLKGFNSWNPFLRMEPDAKVTYSGPAAGRGAAYAWEGRKTGAGRMEIVETAAPSRVEMRLEFLKPFVATNTAEFTIDGRGRETTVTWAMSGRMSFVHKLMGVLFNSDKMVGKSFEDGLANLKAQVES